MWNGKYRRNYYSSRKNPGLRDDPYFEEDMILELPAKTDDAVVPDDNNYVPTASTSKETKPFAEKSKSQRYSDAAEVKGLHDIRLRKKASNYQITNV